ncbi:acyl-CoA dehydrogenase [bacterium]|nr:MAG: acyl-CoA dehydrogenase [bacterium]
MTPELSPAESHFLDSVRSFAAEQVAPFTREWEDARAFPEDIWTRLGSAGLLDMTLTPEHGGRGLSCTVYCEAIRELAKADPALAMNVAAVNALCVSHVDLFGTDEQRAKYLKGMVAGTVKLAWGLTEPDAGSDARRVRTKATPIEDRPGFYRIDGQKMFITNAGRADLIILIARTSDTELSAFLVETDQPGFKLGERIHTVGVSASFTSQFTLEGAIGWHTPCSFEQAISLLYRGRLAIGAMGVGIAERAYELMVERAKDRQQFNRRLADMQSVQNMIADSAMDVEAATLLLRNGTKLYDQGRSVVKESSFAKLYASEAANRVTNRAIQIHGGRGLTREFLVEKLWRDAKLTEIGEGASEIQRMVIAKQVLK